MSIRYVEYLVKHIEMVGSLMNNLVLTRYKRPLPSRWKMMTFRSNRTMLSMMYICVSLGSEYVGVWVSKCR